MSESTIEKSNIYKEGKYYMPLNAGVYQPKFFVPTAWFDLEPEELPEETPDWYRAKHKKITLRPDSKYKTVAEWFDALGTGIKSRPTASPDETIEYMGVQAIQDLMEKTGDLSMETVGKIGLVLSSSTVIDVENGEFPAYNDESKLQEKAEIIAEKSGLDMGKVTSLNEGCAGGVGGIARAIELLKNNSELQGVIVLASERLSDIINPNDIITKMLFSDGASAVLVTCREVMKAIGGKGAELLGSRKRLDESTKAQEMLCIKPETAPKGTTQGVVMDGRQVFVQAVSSMKNIVLELAEELGLTPDLVLAHQANKRIVDKIQKDLKQKGLGAYLPEDMETGNSSSVTVFRLLNNVAESMKPEDLKEGMNIFFSAFGMGLNTSAVAARIVDFEEKKLAA